MKCEAFEIYVVDYIDQDLEQSMVSEIEEHLESCKECNSVHKQYKELLHLMSRRKQEEPDNSLRMGFYQQLKESMDQIATEGHEQKKKNISVNWNLTFGRMAAGIAILIAGAFIGYAVQKGFKSNTQADQIDKLQMEIGAMKEVLMFTLLDEESPSQRIQAVNYTAEIPNPDSKIIHVLINTLNNDQNVNVRVAAAYSLEKFSDHLEVRDSLITSLENQTDPILQVILMNILVENQETRAVEAMRNLVSDKNTLMEVRDIAEKSIDVLL